MCCIGSFKYAYFSFYWQSYGRAIELDSSRVFALIESGNIQLMLGYFRKVGTRKYFELMNFCVGYPWFFINKDQFNSASMQTLLLL
jgi:hypothetical protein